MAYQGRQNQSQLTSKTYNPYYGKSGGYGGGTRPPQPPKKNRRRVRWGRILMVLLVLFLVMGTTAFAGYGYYLQRKVIDPAAGQLATLDKNKSFNVLLVGLDHDPNGNAARRKSMNADELILAHIDPAHHKASLLAIPSNSRVQLPTGEDKISTAYAGGGMDALKQSVRDLTGLSVDRYLMLDFPAFTKAIDAIGGVNFDVDVPITDPEGTVSLQTGPQTVTGPQALAIVRYRGGAGGDVARVKRQQQFLTALGDKMQSLNLVQWMKGLQAMSDTLQTDMSLSEMGMLATSLHGTDTSYTTDIVPGDPLDLYGVSYWQVNLDQLHAMVADMSN